ncbi:autotransporter domain-containing protein [Basilea psittacipulmonis]|uniref:autotransporter domain-containing protein n=1 Tax=Basilea psittacipulmonis TaxID=1472345 RepID=UPI00117772DF|nr:autotransporter domain-containing protein [Basilea psittacipulmonis]
MQSVRGGTATITCTGDTAGQRQKITDDNTIFTVDSGASLKITGAEDKRAGLETTLDYSGSGSGLGVVIDLDNKNYSGTNNVNNATIINKGTIAWNEANKTGELIKFGKIGSQAPTATKLSLTNEADATISLDVGDSSKASKVRVIHTAVYPDNPTDPNDYSTSIINKGTISATNATTPVSSSGIMQGIYAGNYNPSVTNSGTISVKSTDAKVDVDGLLFNTTTVTNGQPIVNNEAGGKITVEGLKQSSGVRSTTAQSALEMTNAGEITVTGQKSYGINTTTNNGATTIENKGKITSKGVLAGQTLAEAYGVYINSQYNGYSKADGNLTVGVTNEGTIDVSSEIGTATTIATTDRNKFSKAVGVYGYISGTDNDVTLTNKGTGSAIKVTGPQAVGMYASVNAAGNATTTNEGNITVTQNAKGIQEDLYLYSNSVGMYAFSREGNATAVNTGTITLKGEESNGQSSYYDSKEISGSTNNNTESGLYPDNPKLVGIMANGQNATVTNSASINATSTLYGVRSVGIALEFAPNESYRRKSLSNYEVKNSGAIDVSGVGAGGILGRSFGKITITNEATGTIKATSNSYAGVDTTKTKIDNAVGIQGFSFTNDVSIDNKADVTATANDTSTNLNGGAFGIYGAAAASITSRNNTAPLSGNLTIKNTGNVKVSGQTSTVGIFGESYNNTYFKDPTTVKIENSGDISITKNPSSSTSFAAGIYASANTTTSTVEVKNTASKLDINANTATDNAKSATSRSSAEMQGIIAKGKSAKVENSAVITANSNLAGLNMTGIRLYAGDGDATLTNTAKITATQTGKMEASATYPTGDDIYSAAIKVTNRGATEIKNNGAISLAGNLVSDVSSVFNNAGNSQNLNNIYSDYVRKLMGIYVKNYSSTDTPTVENTGDIKGESKLFATQITGVYVNSNSVATDGVIKNTGGEIDLKGASAVGLMSYANKGKAEITSTGTKIKVTSQANTEADAASKSEFLRVGPAVGIYARSTSGVANITNQAVIEAEGPTATAIETYSGSNTTSVTNGAALTVTGNVATGIKAYGSTTAAGEATKVTNSADITITRTPSNTTTSSAAIYAQAGGKGDVKVENTNTASKITLTANAASDNTTGGGTLYGIYASGQGKSTVVNKATIVGNSNLTSQSITGIYASASSLAAGDVSVDTDKDINLTARTVTGISAQNGNGSTALNLTKGNITVTAQPVTSNTSYGSDTVGSATGIQVSASGTGNEAKVENAVAVMAKAIVDAATYGASVGKYETALGIKVNGGSGTNATLVNKGAITTEGASSIGLMATAYSSTTIAKVENNAAITTTQKGKNISGVASNISAAIMGTAQYANVDVTNNGAITLNGEALSDDTTVATTPTLSTTESKLVGIYGELTNSSNTKELTVKNNAAITGTSTLDSTSVVGVLATSEGNGTVKIINDTSDSTINLTGASVAGLMTSGGQNIDIQSKGGDITVTATADKGVAKGIFINTNSAVITGTSDLTNKALVGIRAASNGSGGASVTNKGNIALTHDQSAVQGNKQGFESVGIYASSSTSVAKIENTGATVTVENPISFGQVNSRALKAEGATKAEVTNDSALTIKKTASVYAEGIRATANATTGTATVNNKGEINVESSASNAYAAGIYSTAGEVTVENTANITSVADSSNNYAAGIVSTNSSATDVTLKNLNNAVIKATNNGTGSARGIYATASTTKGTVKIETAAGTSIVTDNAAGKAQGLYVASALNSNIQNNGTITATTAKDAYGIQDGSLNSVITNTADIKATGTSSAYGMYVENTTSKTVGGTTKQQCFGNFCFDVTEGGTNVFTSNLVSSNITNDANLTVKANNATDSAGIYVGFGADTTAASITNTKTIELTGSSDKATSLRRSAITFASDGNTAKATFTVDNSGTIQSDDNSYAITLSQIANPATGAIEDNETNIAITNTGTISSALGVKTQAGADSYTQTGSNSMFEGVLDMDKGDDVATFEDGYIIGKIYMGEGSDTVSIASNVDTTGLTVLDGGDDYGTADGWVDTLILNGERQIFTDNQGTTATSRAGNTGINLLDWENIDLGDGTTESVATLAGNLEAETVNIANNATLKMSEDINSPTIKGSVVNSGTIDLTGNKQTGDTLTIDGNYTGNSGSTIKLNFVLNDDKEFAASDNVVITGTASGESTVELLGEDNTAVVLDGNAEEVSLATSKLPIISVQGNSDFQVTDFKLTGTLETTGASDVKLVRNGANNYYWGPSYAWVTNRVGANATNYLGMIRVNQEQGFMTLSTYHERRGDNIYTYPENKQSWGRIYGRHISQDGAQFIGLDTNFYGIQIGHDFRIRYNENGRRDQTGVYFAYNQASADFMNYTRDDPKTGRGTAKNFSLGITHTRLYANMTYIDLVAQVSHTRNKYKPIAKEARGQDTWGYALSAEYGRPFVINERRALDNAYTTRWTIEPQAQLVYQYMHMNDFRDETREIATNVQHALRGRLGARAVYHTNEKNTVYAVANIWHDFLKPRKMNIGEDAIRETYASTWGELGVGSSMKFNRNTAIYGDVRYERSLSGTKRHGVRGTVGLSYNWK